MSQETNTLSYFLSATEYFYILGWWRLANFLESGLFDVELGPAVRPDSWSVESGWESSLLYSNILWTSVPVQSAQDVRNVHILTMTIVTGGRVSRPWCWSPRDMELLDPSCAL